ncbi:uncharacterized protein LOC134432684 [Melospiza melodia melodia]|uniref:uncharacterized protein LOC134432684 n=1 Tax=Melospiza melodia melodia TaxID=1914991 RepID=UPI002FCF6B88
MEVCQGDIGHPAGGGGGARGVTSPLPVYCRCATFLCVTQVSPGRVPILSPEAMEPRELLEALVDVVATLGELAATVARPYGDVLLHVSPRSLHKALETFMGHLQDTLKHPGDASLAEALAAFGATPGATWAHVTAAASAWRDAVATLKDSWARLAREATELRDACRDAATAEATTAATSSALAGDLQDKATRWGRAQDNLVAKAWRPRLPLAKEKMASAESAHEAQVAAAAKETEATTKAMEEAEVVRSKGEAATRRGQRALMAKVAEAEQLWKASSLLAKRHLLGTLRDIHRLLSITPGGPGGLSGLAVAMQCQKAIKDIPRLLQEQ